MSDQVFHVSGPSSRSGSRGGDTRKPEGFTRDYQQSADYPAIGRCGTRQDEGQAEEEEWQPAAISKQHRPDAGGERQLCFADCIGLRLRII